ncbi:MAG: hypothetical protein ACI4EW_09980 [Butyrivibrio sp.]
MSAKTKILVLKLKQLIYTVIFVVLGIILIILLFLIIKGKTGKEKSASAYPTFAPGVYTSSIVLANSPLDLQITVDEEQVKSITLVNVSESVETMYPLLSSSLSEISAQVIDNNSTEHITYSQDSKYTSIVLINTINTILDKARR